MPVQRCTKDGKKGYRWGSEGKCYVYTAGNEASRKEAKRKAHLQGAAIGKAYTGSWPGPPANVEKAAKADDEQLTDAEYKRRRSASLKATTEAVEQMGAAMAAASEERVKGISQTEWDAAVVEDQATEEGE